VLRGYTRELADAVWAAKDPVGVEEVVVPLSRESHRYVHLLGVPTYLRLFGPVLSLAGNLEGVRASAAVATSARYAPCRSRARVLLPGGYDRWDAGLARVAAASPFVLRLDLATFFPSLTPDVISKALSPFGDAETKRFLDELQRLGIGGLPVGSVPARLVAEAVLHALDLTLESLDRQWVRALDDLAIGVESHQDAEALIVQIASAIRPLELNKSKTRIIPASVTPEVPEDPADIVRRLLVQPSPDRVQLARALGRLRQEVPGWESRKRERWLKLLTDAVVRLRVCVPQVLRLIELVMPGTDGPDWGVLCKLFGSPEALHRAAFVRFVSGHQEGIRAQLTRFTLADESALVRREALFGLARIGAASEVRALLRGSPMTELDRSAWIVAAGVVGGESPPKLKTPYQSLLHTAASEHGPRDI